MWMWLQCTIGCTSELYIYPTTNQQLKSTYTKHSDPVRCTSGRAMHTLVASASLDCHCSASIHSTHGRTDVNNNNTVEHLERKISYLHNYSNYFVFSSRFYRQNKTANWCGAKRKAKNASRSGRPFDRQVRGWDHRNGKEEKNWMARSEVECIQWAEKMKWKQKTTTKTRHVSSVGSRMHRRRRTMCCCSSFWI